MSITISFDPANVDDVEYVRSIIDGETPAVEETPAPAKPARKAKAAPAPEPEEATDGPTLETAVERATELVSEGRSAEVKGALANFGVRRVSELAEEQVAEFLAALDEDAVV